jgi:hypothetical protein
MKILLTMLVLILISESLWAQDQNKDIETEIITIANNNMTRPNPNTGRLWKAFPVIKLQNSIWLAH